MGKESSNSAKMTVKSILILLNLILFAATSQAQILNVEKSRIKEDSANYFVGKLGLSFTLHNHDEDEDGPNTFIGLTANTNTAYLSKKNSYILINYINYTALGEEEASHTGYSHFRVNLSRHKKVSTELFTQYQYDLGRGLLARWLIGGGLRIVLLENDKTLFIFGPGLMYEYEKWENIEETTVLRTKRLVKSTNYLSLRKKLNDHINFNTIAYYQTGYDQSIEGFRHRISGEANLSVSITEKLFLTTTFNCTYENKPIVPVTKFIYSITNGLEYNF